MEKITHLVHFVFAQFAAVFGLYQLCVAIDQNAPSAVIMLAALITALGATACLFLVLTMPTEKGNRDAI